MEAFVGTITLFAGNFAPSGWFFCDGQELDMRRYAALYSILGNQYGGNGTTTFALPNIAPLKDSDGRGQSIYIICYTGLYPMRD